MQILVLEDNGPMRLALKDCLEAAGHEVVSAASTSEAETYLRSCSFDLLVFDLVIGAGLSISTIRWADDNAPDVEIIVVTGSQLFSEGELRAQLPNVSWTLRKPFPLGDTVSLAAFCERRGNARLGDERMQ